MDSSIEKQFVEYVIRAMVTKPSDVIVTDTADEMGLLLTVTANKADMSRIIGKQGHTIEAIRQILRIVGFNNKSRVTLQVVDPV